MDAIFARRSIGRLDPPAPSGADLDTILRAAAAAPDHLELRPLRIVTLEGDAKDRFGEVLARAYDERCRRDDVAAVPAKREKELTKLGRAPLVLAVGAIDTTEGRIPFDEQVASVAAAAQNILLAATSLGYGAMWRTGDPAYDPMIKHELGMEAIVGFIYIGTIGPDRALPRREPELDGIVSSWP